MALFDRQAARLSVVALALLLGSCTSKPAPSPSTSTPPVSLGSSSPSPTDPRVGAVQAAVAAYRGMWQAYNSAVQIPNPDSPDLARYATGSALQTLVSGLKSVKGRGLKGTGQLVLAPEVTEISPTNAPAKVGVRDCFDDGGTHLVRVSPGSQYSDPPGGRRLCLATVERQGDASWKVTQFGLRGVGTC
jgi:hypothetical protein